MGMEVSAFAGYAPIVGVTARVERRAGAHSAMTYRLGVGASQPTDSRKAYSPDMGQLRIGYRRYSGATFAGVDGGVWLIETGYGAGVVPVVFGEVGVKLGALELGVNAGLPTFTIGVQVGLDLPS